MENKNRSELIKQITSFAYKTGKGIDTVFGDLLDYIIGYLSPVQRTFKWDYTKEQTFEVYKMMNTYFLAQQEELRGRGWGDVWGDFFMEIMKGVTKYRGQFFTPVDVVDILAECALSGKEELSESDCGKFGHRVSVDDPTCGSGRTLLAAAEIIMRKTHKKPFLCGEDIDSLCTKMTAINLCVHGHFGEVVCHDTLGEPDKVHFGYIINEGLYPNPDGLPTIRLSCDPYDFYVIRNWKLEKLARAQELKKQQHAPVPARKVEKTAKKKEPTQLSFFDIL